MFKKFGFLVAGLLAGNALAASALVWNAAGDKGTVPPYGNWYTYPTKATTTTSATLSNGTSGEQKLVAKVSLSDNSSAAGMGFSFGKAGTVVDLSAYKGVCLDYSATKPFRFDIMQSSISDYDYNGIKLAAKTTHGTVYVAFADLAQEGWGTPVDFDPSDVEKFQFSYKKSIAAEASSTTNTISIYSVTLANSCTQHAPTLASGASAYNNQTLTLLEGDTHEIALSKMFQDEDEDDLNITVAVTSANGAVKLVETAKSFTLKDTIHFVTASNPEGNASVVITATDPTNKSVKLSFTLVAEDRENAPVAKNTSFSVPEDSSYRSPLSARMETLGFDADGDELNFVIVSEPAHGAFSVDADGIYTYTPDADYNGTDSFTYKFVEVENPASVSNIATCTITVTPVNDPAEVTVVAKTFVDAAGEERAFGDTLVVDEDFTAFSITVPSTNITVTDVDGEDDIVIDAKSSGVVNAKYVALSASYGIEISAIKDANGLAKVSLAVGDHKLAPAIVICYVKVLPVVDAPVAKNDEYTIPQDSLFKVVAKDGVLKNDANPDSVPVTVILYSPAEHGTVELAKDGSFTYKSNEGFEGVEEFAYKLVYGSDTTKMAVVTINVVYKNKAPAIVEGVLDTVGTRLSALVEDFTIAKTYSKKEILTWFKDDQDTVTALTFSVRSDDSLLAPSIIASTGAISIKAVKDACGDAEVIVTAKDKGGATTDLKIPASIKCVNDRPVVTAADTIYINADSAFAITLNLPDYFYDADGDSLIYTAVDNPSLVIVIEGDSLYVSANPGLRYNMGMTLPFVIKASDGTVLVSSKFCIKLGPAPAPAAIAPVIAAPKSTWQNAILANRGVAAMFDMQGRVMWKQKLPVSEAEVRAAASSVQGRKILMVNKQAFSIK